MAINQFQDLLVSQGLYRILTGHTPDLKGDGQQRNGQGCQSGQEKYPPGNSGALGEVL